MNCFARRLAVATCLVAFASGAANAQNTKTYIRTAAAGRVVMLGHYASVNPDCTSRGKTVVRVVSAPAHGSLNFETGPGFTSFSREPQCNARTVEGVTALYRSERGYVGADAVGFDIIYPSGREKFKTYNIVIK